MLSYCVRQRKRTECVPNSETFVITKNGRNAMRCICAECGIAVIGVEPAVKYSFV